jgi:uncharacterized protein (DUF849 family)
MLIQAALNGGRTRSEHPAIPCTPEPRQARLLFEAVSRGVGLAFGLLFPKLLLPS